MNAIEMFASLAEIFLWVYLIKCLLRSLIFFLCVYLMICMCVGFAALYVIVKWVITVELCLMYCGYWYFV